MIGSALITFLQLMEVAIFIRIIISWIPVSRDSQLIRYLYQITEPILAPIRGFVERSSFGRNMMFDFSPIIAILLIGAMISIVARTFHTHWLLF